MTTDLVHLMRTDTVGTDSSLCLLSRSNLTTPFRVVRHDWKDSRDILWDCPCRAAVRRAIRCDRRLERELGLVT